MEAMLTKLGCRCIMAFQGADAMAYATSDIRFDVIFLDIQMPLGGISLS
jgi:serine/threonine-protein kinase RIM15